MSAGFSQVDANQDARFFVQLVDRMNAMTQLQDVKRVAHSLLAAQPGERFLEVGSGTGEDAVRLAEAVGPGGSVVGVEPSEIMLDEARRRFGDRELPLEWIQADAEALPFPDGSFDGAHADRVLQHVADPARVIGEMVRVTRSGGRIVISDTDWVMTGVDAADQAVTDRIIQVFARLQIRNGSIGRQLRGLLLQAGLLDVDVIPHPLLFTDWQDHGDWASMVAMRAVQAQAIAQQEADAWLEDLAARGEAGRYLAVIMMFTVAGRVP
ncbi:MAG TPA: methyltransferase domain-containing protein [Chloroflexota bacterium]